MEYDKKHLYNMYITTPGLVAKSPTYLRFDSEPCSGLYNYLKANTVRGSNAGAGEFNLHETHFKKGKLATSWPQTILADRIGCSRVTVSQRMKDLVGRGFVKIEKLIRYGKTYNIYILGYIDHETGKEKWFAEEYFIKQAILERLKRDSEKVKAV